MKKSLFVMISILFCLGVLISLGMNRDVYSENESGTQSDIPTSYLNIDETDMPEENSPYYKSYPTKVPIS